MQSRRSCGLFCLAACLAMSTASAVPITYTLTGYLQGTAGGGAFNTSYTWVISADTSGIFNANTGILRNPAVSSSLTLNNVGTLQLVNTAVTLNTNTGAITFGTPGAGGTGFPSNATLKTWDMASSIGPINNPNGFVPGILNATDGTIINITGATNPGGGPAPSFQASTAPMISSISNAATQILPAFPNSGIAQGSIALLLGVNLGPSAIVVDSMTPFQHTNLSNTSVAIKVGATTVAGLMYYTASPYVSFLLPSNTPTGTGTVTVMYNNQTSPAFPIKVVANNIGMFTYTQDGQGIGILSYPDYTLVSSAKAATCGAVLSPCGAANEGDTLIAWTTGLGSAGGTDTDPAVLGVDMPNIPLKVWVGGIQAQVLFRGKGCCYGEDQVVFVVPAGITGCLVPLTMQIGTQVSNTTAMAIAKKGSRTCTPSDAATASVDVETAIQGGPVTYAQIKLNHSSNFPNPGFNDLAKFGFMKFSIPASTQPFFTTYVDTPAPGTCLQFDNLNPGFNPPGVTTANLDGGSSFTINGPNGKQVAMTTPGTSRTTLSNTGSYLVPGTYTITGTGGADIGAISTTINFPVQPALTTPNPSNNSLVVTRSNGMTFTWNTTGASGYVFIQVASALDGTFANGALVYCIASATAGTFTVPDYMMDTLPTGPFGAYVFSSQAATVPFTAKGLGLGVTQTNNDGASGFMTLQ